MPPEPATGPVTARAAARPALPVPAPTPAPTPALRSAAVGPDHPLFAERYRAMSSKDVRFDGQFIAGVRSTGIYCRPSCPAMTPHAQNVTFYRTAAAAHEAGLRACKRCRPDAEPGSSEWNLQDDIASRAMRLISDGVVDRSGVPGLAAHLGYTSRHLTRVLVNELGAGPLALARAHRAQTAQTLLTATNLSIADVAFASGFSSVRAFNETIGSVFDRTPSQLRGQASGGPGRRSAGVDPGPSNGPAPTLLTLRLPARAPFDGPGLMRFFADHAIAGVEGAGAEDGRAEGAGAEDGRAEDGGTGVGTAEVDASQGGGPAGYSRVVRLPAGTAHIDIRLEGEAAVTCTALIDNVADISPLVSRVRRLFDLDADSRAIDAALAADPALAPSVARFPGVRLPGSLDAEETLFRTLVGQQISVAAARTVLGRLCGELSPGTGLFPTATQFAEGGARVLRGPPVRVATILRVAEALAEGTLVLDVGASEAELQARLVALPGIGPWTAGYVAMRVLGSPDVLLSSDLIMLQSAARLGLPGTAKALAAHGRRWAPWRSYAGLHLWRSANR